MASARQSGVPPWTFEGLIFRRDALSGTQAMIATAIGVPADRWKGTATTSSSDLLMRLGMANFPDQSIGILSAEVAQDNRDNRQGAGVPELRPDLRDLS